jgi:site-specific DNA recombinase
MNCLLYARVSTDKQAQKELSIPAQLDAMRQFAKRQDWKIVGHFVDRGESAKTANRPELKRLLAFCEEHQGIDAVLVHKIDRLARSVYDHSLIKFALRKRGIRLQSVTENFQNDPNGEFMENILASHAQFYSANLGFEIRKANMAKLKLGEWPHMPPVGYKSVPGVHRRVAHVPDDNAAPLIQQAFELFATGRYSLKGLSETMHDRGLGTRSGRMFSEENMKRLLSREYYVGRLVWNGQVYQGKHPPIISKKLFYEVQDVLKSRSVDTGEKGRLEFLLRGVVYCHVCQRRLTGEVHPRGRYYRCLVSVDQQRCSQSYIPVKELDAQLETLYGQLRPTPGYIEVVQAEMHGIADRRKRVAERDLGKLRRRVTEIGLKEMRLLDEMLASTVAREIYEKMAGTYRKQRQQAESRVAQLQVNYDDSLKFVDECSKVAGMLGQLHRQFTFEQRKNLLRAVFRRIEVEDKTIVGAELNPPFSFFFDEQVHNLLTATSRVRRLVRKGKASTADLTPVQDIVRASRSVVPETKIEQIAHFMHSGNYAITEHSLKSATSFIRAQADGSPRNNRQGALENGKMNTTKRKRLAIRSCGDARLNGIKKKPNKPSSDKYAV